MQDFIGLAVQIAGILVLTRIGWRLLKHLMCRLHRVLLSLAIWLRSAATPRRKPMAIPDGNGGPTRSAMPAPPDWDLAVLEIPTCLRRQQTSKPATATDATFD